MVAELLQGQGDAVKAEALARARQQLASGQSPEAALEFLAHTLTNRLLHPPTAALREAAAIGDTAMLEAVERMLPADGHAAAAGSVAPAPDLPDRPDEDDAAHAAP